MSRNNKHTSFLILFLSSLILMFVGCQKSPEQAKKELTEMKIDFSEESFIMYAAYNDLKVVKLFLQAGMNPNSEMNGITALAAALFGNSELAAKEIVKNSPTINSIPEQTCRIFEKRIKMIELLIEHGADVNFYSKDGTSLLMGAATLQIYPIVYQCLLKLNPNTKNYKALNIMTKDMTPQIESYLTEQLIAVVKIFLKHNLDPNHVNNDACINERQIRYC